VAGIVSYEEEGMKKSFFGGLNGVVLVNRIMLLLLFLLNTYESDATLYCSLRFGSNHPQ
jgi:hypothetical protein